MSRIRFCASFFSLLLALSLNLLAQSSSDSGSVPHVRIAFTARDRSSTSSITLHKEDLRILEDGEPQQIIAVEHQAAVPVSMSFLIDMSSSMAASSLPIEQAATLSLLNSTLRSGKDMAALHAFAGESLTIQPLTTDLMAVESAIQRLKYEPTPQKGKNPQGASTASDNRKVAPVSTAIWDAIVKTCGQTLDQPIANARRIIILVSDGIDTGSQKSISDAINSAIKSNTIVYTFRLGDQSSSSGLALEGEINLFDIAQRTGGRAFSPKNVRDLESPLARIRQDLQSQYVVTYSSSSNNPSKPYKKIEIKVINPHKKEELELLYPRKVYLAQR